VLADPFGPLVHRLGEPPDVLLPLGVGDLGHPLAPRAQRQRDQRLDHRPHPRVQHAGHVPGSFEGPGPDRCLGDLGGVQAGQLGGLHGPVQPGGLRAELAAPFLRQRVLDYPQVALVVCGLDLVGPAGVQQAEVVGPGQALALVLGRRVLARLPVQAVGEHRGRLPPIWFLLLCGAGRQSGALAAEQVRAGQFWVDLRPGAGVSDPGLRDDARGVSLPPASERDVDPFTPLTAAEHRLAAGHGAALAVVPGDRVAQIGHGELSGG